MIYTTLNETNLEAVYALASKVLEADQIPLHIFRYKTLEDPDFDPEMTVVAMDGDMPCAFMIGVARKGKEEVSAGIKFFGVSGAYRNQGIASRMLEKVETRAKEMGATNINIGFTRPNYLFAGVDGRAYTVACAFLLRRGFLKRGEAFNMDVDLFAADWNTDEMETRLAGQSITCRRLQPEEFGRFQSWMAVDGFSEGWQYQVMRAATLDPPAVFIAEQEGRYLAFAAFDGVRPGWFGPMGTAASFRGSGIGTVTYLKCLQDMKARGYKICEVNSVGPLYFYSKVSNAKVSRIFWQFDKDI